MFYSKEQKTPPLLARPASEQEAYQELARRIRAAMSERKLALYREIAEIEKHDEQKDPYELVRTAGQDFPITVGDTVICAYYGQPDQFTLLRNQTEWHGYIEEILTLLDKERKT